MQERIEQQFGGGTTTFDGSIIVTTATGVGLEAAGNNFVINGQVDAAADVEEAAAVSHAATAAAAETKVGVHAVELSLSA